MVVNVNVSETHEEGSAAMSVLDLRSMRNSKIIVQDCLKERLSPGEKINQIANGMSKKYWKGSLVEKILESTDGWGSQ